MGRQECAHGMCVVFNKSRQKVNYAQAINYASLVKVDHMVYKQNGYMAIHTWIDSEEANAVLVDNHNCRFGGWYYQGDGREFYGNTMAYREIESPHSEVHLDSPCCSAA